MQIGTEVCVKKENTCKDSAWGNLVIWLGIIVLSFLEPLAIMAQLMRSLRLRKIFDAQEIFKNEDKRPTEMINRYAEWNLIRNSLIFSLSTFALYTIPFIILSFTREGKDKWVLPVEFPDFFVV